GAHSAHWTHVAKERWRGRPGGRIWKYQVWIRRRKIEGSSAAACRCYLTAFFILLSTNVRGEYRESTAQQRHRTQNQNASRHHLSPQNSEKINGGPSAVI